MPHLRIEKLGPGIDLYIGRITTDELDRLEKAVPRLFGIYRKKTFYRIWYHDAQVMYKVFGVRSWTQICEPGYRYYGPLLSGRDRFPEFCDALDITIDGSGAGCDPAKIRTRFRKKRPVPALKAGELLVLHGERYSGTTHYSCDVKGRFDAGKLAMVFEDAGENGYTLSHFTYDGREIRGRDDIDPKEALALHFVHPEPPVP